MKRIKLISPLFLLCTTQHLFAMEKAESAAASSSSLTESQKAMKDEILERAEQLGRKVNPLLSEVIEEAIVARDVATKLNPKDWMQTRIDEHEADAIQLIERLKAEGKPEQANALSEKLREFKQNMWAHDIKQDTWTPNMPIGHIEEIINQFHIDLAIVDLGLQYPDKDEAALYAMFTHRISVMMDGASSSSQTTTREERKAAKHAGRKAEKAARKEEKRERR